MTPHELSLLRDIASAANEIRDRVQHVSDRQFFANRDLQLVIERLFTILGEAAARLQKHFPQTAARIAGLRGAVAFRNFLIHVYDRVDPNKVWDIVQADLPSLASEAKQLLDTHDPGHD